MAIWKLTYNAFDWQEATCCRISTAVSMASPFGSALNMGLLAVSSTSTPAAESPSGISSLKIIGYLTSSKRSLKSILDFPAVCQRGMQRKTILVSKQIKN
jgi:hypothetical protein